MNKVPAEAERLMAAVRPVSRETWERLTVYVDLLGKWQKQINLVANASMDDVWNRHVVDSVQTYHANPTASHWLDMGSGAGFPGLVTAILLAERGQGRVDLIESVGKKCSFMRAVVRETDLASAGIDVQIHNGRIESVISNISGFEAVSARALASLHDLLTYTEGRLVGEVVGIFAKGRDHEAEIAEAQRVFDFDVEIKKSGLSDGSVLLAVSNVERIR